MDVSVDYGSFAHTRVTDDQDFEGVVLARCAGCATCRSLGWPTHMRMDTTTGTARGTHKSTRQLFAVTAPSCRPIGRTPLRSAVARPCACGLGGALHFFEPSAKRAGKRQLPISQRREGTRAPAYSYMQHVMRNRAGLQKHARAAGRLRDLPCTPTADKPRCFFFALNGFYYFPELDRFRPWCSRPWQWACSAWSRAGQVGAHDEQCLRILCLL